LGGGDEAGEEVIGVEVGGDEAEVAAETGAADVINMVRFAVECGDLGA
jgi:hypothetical protein